MSRPKVCSVCDEPVRLDGIYVHTESGDYWSDTPIRHHVRLEAPA